MFGPVLKIVRALLCALALTLIGVGSPALARTESHGGGERADWGAVKRIKPAPAITPRAGAACLVALAAAQAATGRVWVPASERFVRFFAPPEGCEQEAPAIREAERQTRPCARAGVVRLLI